MTSEPVGYNKDTVEAFCLMCQEIRTVPLIGDPRMKGRLYGTVKLSESFYRYNLNVNELKNAAFHQLFAAEPGSGYCHLYRDFPEDHLHHFTAEHQVRHRERGQEYLLWVPKKAGLPNQMWGHSYRFLSS